MPEFKTLSPDLIAKLLDDYEAEDARKPRLADAFYRHGFDKQFLFYLTMRYENLFEPWTSKYREYEDGWWFRCKGCGRKVKRNGRQSHHEWHKKELLNL